MRKKELLKIVAFTIFTVIFTGCMGVTSSNVSLQEQDKLYLSKSIPFAYAYMENGDKLAYIKFTYEEPKSGFEVIKISKDGFYPNYLMEMDIENGSKSPGCLVVMKETDRNYSFCRSNYTRRTILSSGVSTIWNAGATVTMVGLNVATGAIADPKFFDKDKFLQIVKDNNLMQIKTKISELLEIEKIHNIELTNLYDNELNRYKNNMNNVNFDYTYVDESGLLFNSKPNLDLEIVSNPPSKNLNSYLKYIQDKEFSSLNDFTGFLEDLIKKLNGDSQNKKDLYINDYLKKNFNNYKLMTYDDTVFKLNENIVFHGKVIFPKNIDYKYGIKTIVPIKVIVKSVDMKNIAPQNFLLTDNNMNVNFNKPRNSYIDVIMRNRTGSFLTVKSLTSYVGSDVYIFSNNINRELAPESETLDSDSEYAMFNSLMVNKLNLYGVTKDTLLNKKIDYGFAIKYHIQDSNLEKTIFKKNSFSYLELYKSYL